MSDRTLAILLFVGLLVVYQLNGDFYPIEDATPSALVAESLLRDGNLSFTAAEIPDTVIWTLHGKDDESQRVHLSAFDGEIAKLKSAGPLTAGEDYCDGGRCVPTIRPGVYVNTFMPGAGLTAVPVFAVWQAVAGPLSDGGAALWYGGKLVASLCVAISAAFIYLTAATFVRRSHAVVIAMAYGLGTCVWTISSQALWQHGPNEMYLAMGTFFLTRISRGAGYAALCGLSFGAATWCRPTGAVVVVAVGLSLLFRERRALLAYLAAGAPLALAMLAYNFYYFGSPLSFGQTNLGQVAIAKTGSDAIWSTPFWYGMLAILLSPSRGLLIFSPFLGFAIWGAWKAWRDPAFAVLRPLSPAILGIWCIEAQHFDWWGGWGYGYRHIVDTATLLVVFLVPVIGVVLKRRRMRRVFFTLLGWSVLVQIVGALAFNLSGWNARRAFMITLPDRPRSVFVYDEVAVKPYQQIPGARIQGIALNVDRREHRHRLWSLTDNQILYYMTHLLEARAMKRKLAAEAVRGPAARQSESYAQLGHGFLELHDFPRAVEWFQKSLSVDPSEAEARDELGLALALRGDVDGAVAYYREQLDSTSQDSRLLNRLGLALLLNHRLTEAVRQFEAARQRAPRDAVGDSEYVFTRWRELSSAAKMSAAERASAAARIQSARKIIFDLREGDSDLRDGNLDEAEAHFEKAIELCPQLPEARNNLGKTQLSEGRYDDAAESFQHATQLDANFADAYDQLGVALYYQGNLQRARDEFAKAARLDPHHAWAARHLHAIERKLAVRAEATD